MTLDCSKIDNSAIILFGGGGWVVCPNRVNVNARVRRTYCPRNKPKDIMFLSKAWGIKRSKCVFLEKNKIK